MTLRETLRRPRTWFIAVPVIVLLGAVGGPFVYINFVKDDAPPPLEFADVTTTTADPVATTDPAAPTTPTAGSAGLDGTWTVAAGSEVGYRVTESLLGQTADTAGRTTAVTGTLSLSGTTIDAATFTVDLTTLSSGDDFDANRRDGQVQGRILETSSFPTATFTLTSPITVDAIPAEAEEITVEATGDFTIHGVTKSVTFQLLARLVGDTIEVNGSIPVVWTDYAIDDPSGGPATVDDHGVIEFLITFARS